MPKFSSGTSPAPPHIDRMNIPQLHEEIINTELYLSTWPENRRQHEVLIRKKAELTEMLNTKGLMMSYPTEKLPDMTMGQLKEEKAKFEKSLTFFSPPEHYEEVVRLTNEHIERIDVYINQAKMWELVGVDKNVDTPEQ